MNTQMPSDDKNRPHHRNPESTLISCTWNRLASDIVLIMKRQSLDEGFEPLWMTSSWPHKMSVFCFESFEMNAVFCFWIFQEFTSAFQTPTDAGNATRIPGTSATHSFLLIIYVGGFVLIFPHFARRHASSDTAAEPKLQFTIFRMENERRRRCAHAPLYSWVFRRPHFTNNISLKVEHANAHCTSTMGARTTYPLLQRIYAVRPAQAFPIRCREEGNISTYRIWMEGFCFCFGENEAEIYFKK